MESKETLRNLILQKRREISFDRRFRSELLITDRILGHQWYYSATDILVYKSCGSEISTEEIIKDALKHGKTVYLPKVLSAKDGTMEFFRFTKDTLLTEGYGGIPEPPAENPFVYSEKNVESTLMLMPGVAFDRKRNRIGYGKGFYDRYLQDKEALHTIAIGFDCQMVGEIPEGPDDIKPKQVICL